MKLNRRSIVRLLVASLYSVPFAAFAVSPPYTKAASIQNETVFVVQDATNAIVDKRTKHAFIVSVGADNMQPTFWDHFACRIRL